jgi:hypothetical protein
MVPALPPAAYAASAETVPATIEAAFFLARAASHRAAAIGGNPVQVLSGSGSIDEKLAAIDAIQSRIPDAKKPEQAAALDALRAAAGSTAQPPEVRAKALSVLGYSMFPAEDDAARMRALPVLLAALRDPAYRIFALRGLGPACHGLPKAGEGAMQDALLDLLDGPLGGEERQTALTALYAFVSTREDLFKRDPALVAQLDIRLLSVMERSPAGFSLDPRYTPGARALAIATVWISARHLYALGHPEALTRVNRLLDALAAFETDPGTLAWIHSYRTAAPPAAFTVLRERTTRRSPAGPDEP